MLSDLLYQINSNSMILVIFFVITFALLMFILRKTGIGKNNATASVISLAISLLATYGLNRMSWDLTSWVYGIGISENLLDIIAPILILIFVFFLSRKRDPETQRKKFSFGRFLMILGAIMLILGFIPFIYRKGFFIGVGAGLIILGIIIALIKKRNRNGSRSYRGYNSGKYRKEQEKNQRYQQKLAEKQSRWQINQQEEEARRRAKKINKIRGRRERLQAEKDLKKQQDASNYPARKVSGRKAMLRERANQKRNEILAKKQQQREIAKRMQQQQKTQLALPPAKQMLALPAHSEKKYIKNKRLRQRSIQNLKSLYNEKYQEAIKQANFSAKEVPGAKEKYIRLQRELQRIVNKMNRI